MNSFDIRLGPYGETEHPTGCVLSLRSADEGYVAIWARVPKARKGQAEPQFEDVALGKVHTSDLARVLGAVHSLMGGPCG